MKITAYFGFLITLDEDTGDFLAVRDYGNTSLKSQTLKGCKKLIDKFRKSNVGFKTFFMMHFTYTNLLPDNELVEIIGVDKEGCFLAKHTEEDGTSYVETLRGSQEEHSYFVVDARNESILDQIKQLDKQQDELIAQMETLHESLHRKSLRDIRAEAGIKDTLEEYRN